jgi:hypothetical protein
MHSSWMATRRKVHPNYSGLHITWPYNAQLWTWLRRCVDRRLWSEVTQKRTGAKVT